MTVTILVEISNDAPSPPGVLSTTICLKKCRKFLGEQVSRETSSDEDKGEGRVDRIAKLESATVAENIEKGGQGLGERSQQGQRLKKAPLIAAGLLCA